MAFTLGSKFILKLIKTDSSVYDYKVIKYELLTENIRLSGSEKYFELKPEKETIEIIFAVGYNNEGKDEKDFKTVLLLRNNYANTITYNAEIKIWNKENFQKTSTEPLNPGTRNKELWPYKIDNIALLNFKELIKP